MSRWFRSYADTHRNPKVARLSDADFRLWHELLCVAAENNGHIPPTDDLKHLLNRRLDHLSKGLKRLVEGRLIEALSDGYAPRNWDKRQYKSDTSTPRVQKFREKGNVSDGVSETAPETETETDKSSEANASGAEPPADLKKHVFDLGLSLVMLSGKTEKEARSLVGMWRKGRKDGEVLAAFIECQSQDISSPLEWLQKRFQAARWVSKSGYEYRGSDADVLREAERRGDNDTYWAVKAALGREAKAQPKRQHGSSGPIGNLVDIAMRATA